MDDHDHNHFEGEMARLVEGIFDLLPLTQVMHRSRSCLTRITNDGSFTQLGPSIQDIGRILGIQNLYNKNSIKYYSKNYFRMHVSNHKFNTRTTILQSKIYSMPLIASYDGLMDSKKQGLEKLHPWEFNPFYFPRQVSLAIAMV
jgi:hypothetical protein